MTGKRQFTRSILKVCQKGLLAMTTVGICLLAHSSSQLDRGQIVSALEGKYGGRAGQRANAWFKVVDSGQGLSDREKLVKVNKFFNMFNFVDDIKLWGDSNYWATPMEFIGAAGGDCEDFSIAKYFTLLQLGVPDEKLRITMVKATSVNQYHMVLAYYETPGSVPLVLDNLDKDIKPATQRRDLLPVYSFNGKQLWLNKERGRGELAGSSSRLEKWTNLTQRLGVSRLKTPKMRLE